MREYCVKPSGFETPYHRSINERLIGEWVADFLLHGFVVSKEAIVHNFTAWRADLKSGFRDEKSGCHLFSPCGCNALRFDATELTDEGEEWQTTYEC